MPCGTKKENADLTAASSAAQSSLFKESIPTKVHIAEDNTLMGRLASRMAARDYIDKQNLGMGTAAQKAATADAPNASSAPIVKVETGKVGYPEKINISGPAIKEGKKVEMEHEKTVGKISKDDPKTVAKMIAKDHLKEDSKYYKKLKTLNL